MANEKHLEILKKGVEAWNRWRQRNPQVVPDLSAADLTGANLTEANLRQANLHAAILHGADLVRAGLISTDLSGADLSDSIMGYTSIVDVDLSGVKGLETVLHLFPSSIGIDTLYRFQGNIPDVFLRGAGVPEPFIVQMKALVAAMEPIEFYSCFISYSSEDQEFAYRLHADLQQKHVRCWFAPEDMKIGDRIRPSIDEAIRVHDKLLLVLTENSMKSAWVEKEVETAFEKERRQGRTVLFPIRLDECRDGGGRGVGGGYPADTAHWGFLRVEGAR